MSVTSAVDVLAVAFAALDADQQDDAFTQINTIRLRRLAGDESDTGRMIRSLVRVTEAIGHPPTVEEYRRAQAELAAEGEQVEPLSRVMPPLR